MAAPLILRIIEDASSVFKTNDAVVASMTSVGRAALATDSDFSKAAAGQVASSLRVEKALEGQIAAYKALSVSATASEPESILVVGSARHRHRHDVGHRIQFTRSSEHRLLGGSSSAVLVARLDGCHSCGGVGSAKALEIYPTGGKQTVDAALEVT